MTSTSPGTAIDGMSETATSPMAARSGIRAVSTTWSTMIASSPIAADDQERQRAAGVERRGAEGDLLAGEPSRPGSARTVSGVGITHSSAVSRRNTSVMNADPDGCLDEAHRDGRQADSVGR